VGGKGVFTAELEEALRSHEIDAAVHSLKDLPTEDPNGLTVGAVPVRANPSDALISRNGYTLDTLPLQACVGTSSHRRAAQLLRYRPDLRTIDIRGNVDTRIRKAMDPNGPYDAIILAYAGLERLGFTSAISQLIPLNIILPAPGQGALAVQCRAEPPSLTLVRSINHLETQAAAAAERAFLSSLGGGCSLPISAYACLDDGMFRLRGRVSSRNGAHQIEAHRSASLSNSQPTLEAAQRLGLEAAQAALEQGAADLLKEA
jgi:hydroxymethylbilane synthase